jgi:hypothetical protein
MEAFPRAIASVVRPIERKTLKGRAFSPCNPVEASGVAGPALQQGRTRG